MRISIPELSTQLSMLARRYPKLENIPLWLAALLTGICSVWFANVIAHAELVSQSLQSEPWFLIASPLGFVLAWYLVYRLAPEARGSGIPQVIAAISLLDAPRPEDRPHLKKLLGIKTTLVKIASAMVLVTAGGAAGREGPTIQIAASLFYGVFLFVRGIFPAMNAEAWVIAGGAAGLAAAFNTPLGGLVFAIEELATKHFTQFRTTLISSVMVAGLAALWLAGNYLYFGHPVVDALTWSDHLYAVGLGVTGGLAGRFSTTLILFISRERKRRLTKAWHLGAFAALCGVLTLAVAALTSPQALGPGREVVTSLIDGRSLSSLDLILARFFTPVFAYASGAAGGVFAPALATGATIGAWVAQLANSAHSDLFIMMGMIGVLTGVTQAPFTSMVLMIEMTDRHNAIFPMMLAALSGYAAAKFKNPHSFYAQLEADFLPPAHRSPH